MEKNKQNYQFHSEQYICRKEHEHFEDKKQNNKLSQERFIGGKRFWLVFMNHLDVNASDNK